MILTLAHPSAAVSGEQHSTTSRHRPGWTRHTHQAGYIRKHDTFRKTLHYISTDYQSLSIYSCDCAGAMAVSAEVIKQTQASLGQFVKKPPLTDKLLNKPPFR